MRLGKVVASIAAILTVAGCGPKYPNCEKDEHCKEHNEYCVMGLCRECARTEHCVAKGPCVYCGPEYKCVKPQGNPGDCCTSDLDCNKGKCWKQPGREAGRCASCVADEDCGVNMKCVEGSCVSVGECDANRPCPAGMVCENGVCVSRACTLEPIYFDFDKYDIRPDQRPAMERNFECLKQRGQAIVIEGNCDARGDDEYNMVLGSNRAKSIANFLKQRGYTGSIETVSYGERYANQNCTDDTCWQRDRRGDLKFR